MSDLNPVYEKLVEDIKSQNGSVIMFDGYAGLGYAHPEKVRERIARSCVKAIGDATVDGKPLFLVSTGSNQGIGMCYEVAEKLKLAGFNIKTVGIASEELNRFPAQQASGLDYLITVPDPRKKWDVIMPDGDSSYMVDILKHSRNTRAVVLGGGLVTRMQLQELNVYLEAGSHKGDGIVVEIAHGGDFAPNPENVAKHQELAASRGQPIKPDSPALNGAKDYEPGTYRGSLAAPQTRLSEELNLAEFRM